MSFLLNLVAFSLVLAWLIRRHSRGATVSGNVLVALLAGVALGAVCQPCTATTTPPSGAR